MDQKDLDLYVFEGVELARAGAIVLGQFGLHPSVRLMDVSLRTDEGHTLINRYLLGHGMPNESAEELLVRMGGRTGSYRVVMIDANAWGCYPVENLIQVFGSDACGFSFYALDADLKLNAQAEEWAHPIAVL